jgi:HEAT repeat protein
MRIGLILPMSLICVLGCGPSSPTMLHDKPLAHWLTALRDPDVGQRKKAAEVLGKAGDVDPAIVPALLHAARDPESSVRLPALMSLVKVAPESEETVAVLRAASKDRDGKVRSYAVKTLQQMQRLP